MLVDVALGSIVYVIVSFGFGENFKWSTLVFSWLFALLPDIDFFFYFIYLGIRKFFSKERTLVTHHIIHFPLFFVGIALAIGYVSEDAFICTLFLVCTVGHLVNDAFTTPQGVQVFFPFSRLGFQLSREGVHVVTLEERKKIMSERRERYMHIQQKLGAKGELLDRLEKMRTESWTGGSWAVLFFAILAVSLFAFFFPSS